MEKISSLGIITRGLSYSLTTAGILVSGLAIANHGIPIEIFLLGIPFSFSISFFINYAICFHYSKKEAEVQPEELQHAQKEAAKYARIIRVLLVIILLVFFIYNNSGNVSFAIIFSLALYTFLFWRYSTYILKLLKEEKELKIKKLTVRHQLSWPIILTITFILYYAMYFEILKDYNFFYYLCIPVFSLLGFFKLSERYLKDSKTFFIWSAILTLTVILSVFPLDLDSPLTILGYRKITLDILLCFFVSIYLGTFEAWRITAFEKEIAASDNTISTREKPYFPTWKKYYICTLIALTFSICVVPYFYIFSPYSFRFFIGFIIHAFISYSIWYFWGTKSTVHEILKRDTKLELQDFWVYLKILMGFLMLGILIWDSFIPWKEPKFTMIGLVDENIEYGVLGVCSIVALSRLLWNMRNVYQAFESQRGWIIFDRNINIFRIACFFSGVAGLSILIVKKNATNPEILAKTDYAFLFYTIIIIFTTITEGYIFVHEKKDY